MSHTAEVPLGDGLTAAVTFEVTFSIEPGEEACLNDHWGGHPGSPAEVEIEGVEIVEISIFGEDDSKIPALHKDKAAALKWFEETGWERFEERLDLDKYRTEREPT